MTIPIHGDALAVKNLHRPAFVSDTDPAAEDGQAAWKWWLEVDGSDNFVALHVRNVSNTGWITILTADVATNAAIAAAIAAVLDGATFTGDVVLPDEAYDATAWNGSLEAPTKNAVRDKIESLGTGLTDGDKGDITVSSTGAVWTIDNDAVTDAKLRDSAAVSVIGRSANSSGDPADIAAGSNGHFLRRRSNAVGFGAIQDDELPITPWEELTDGATITWDVDGLREAKAFVEIEGNRTLDINNAVDGSAGILRVIQGTGAPWTLALPAGSKIVGGGGTTPTLSEDDTAVDFLAFEYDGTTFWWTVGRGAA